jgi:integrase
MMDGGESVDGVAMPADMASWVAAFADEHYKPEPKRRIRFLTHDEAQRLLDELPEHLADMAAFTLATGLRAANVTGLLWSQVDMVRQLAWIHPDQAKARKAIPVPLNAEAVKLIRAQLGRHQYSCKKSIGSKIRARTFKFDASKSRRIDQKIE